MEPRRRCSENSALGAPFHDGRAKRIGLGWPARGKLRVAGACRSGFFAVRRERMLDLEGRPVDGD